MAETMDIQARNDISSEMIRAKQAQAKLGFDIEVLKRELEDIKAYLDIKTDNAPTRESENLITSGAVYDALMSLNRKIDALR